MQIMIVDGQGGGIGKAVIETIRKRLGDSIPIVALGTNALATSAMLKAGANEGATGENAILVCAPKADVIIGSIAIICANSMLGELTPAMARAIAESPARKLLIPLSRQNISVMGVTGKPLPHYVEDVIQVLKELTEGD
ncbi:MAG: DUF3842 domain-containing protein [Thermocaproicibacter melissae]|jgi:hypothetical protein|uniref:DUF3842 family protein n=1 Tax=Thermocaproicibacter melissae TaxID=2966552 RepID=UPI0024B09F9F|nr:DUF3842 family protein [Thermocaproicibacter melissae]WBY64525.1 DUF3842 family protein [Thermocaproicibacter melissae]